MIRLSATISSVTAAMLVVVMLIPTSAHAQQPNQRPQTLREAAIALALKAGDNRRPASKLAIPAAQAASTRRERSVGRMILGGAIGATAGLFAGGYLGAVIEGDRCHCDDPGLQGALIGAPIGTVVGAILGVKLF